MICLLFSLRYQNQIRRIRPELYSLLEDSILNIIKASCGTVAVERNYIFASFNGEAIGFWLNMLTALEGTRKILDEAASELYGYNCLIGQDLDEADIRLVHLLPSGGSMGIWCDYSVQQTLSSYAAFENSYEEIRGIPAADGYNRVRNFMPFSGGEEENAFPYREKIFKTLNQGSPKNAILAGPRFIGKRDGLRFYCSRQMQGLPTLRIVFGNGGNGMACFADALTGEIRNLITPFAGDEGLEKLDSLGEAIFQERFRRQYSAYFIQKTRRFMELLFKFYEEAVCAKKLKPVIILENINFADAPSSRLFADIFQDKIRTSYLVYGSFSEENTIVSTDTAFDPWNKVFSRIIQVSPENFTPRPFGEGFEMIPDLWEIAYTLSLFRRYFPRALFPTLFREAGINPLVVSRALDIFTAQGIIDSREDPQPRIVDFDSRAERILGERKYLVRGMVSGRILAWVKKGGIRPCYNLLKALADLGRERPERLEGSATLVLNSITGDVINNTFREIEEDIRNNCFAQVIGEGCFTAILYIFTTLRALIHQGEDDIRRAFLQPVPETSAIPEYKAHILSNLADFNLGIYDIAAAQESIKESLILSQTRPDKRRLVQAYRLFSLVNVCKQQLREAIEYSDFAIECAERSGCFDELAIVMYYAAGIHLIFGNLSRAGRLIRRADEYASLTGRVEWADRSRFLLGRFHFETGYYQEARDIFTGLLDRGIPAAPKGREMVLRAWIYRSRVFLNQSPGSLFGMETLDARLFEIEAAYITGEYEKAVSLTDSFCSCLPKNRFVFIEQPDWRSGFAQCELLLFSPKDFFNRQASTYRALALAKLSADANGSSIREMALDTMRRVIREKGLPQMDPNDAFYYYAHYRVLQETGAAAVDMDTAVSIAFKRLQSRASHIDDIETRRSYLSLNYWNNALSQAAKAHRLI
jgi:tetratricopeptide (TPR) repeat protein